MRGVAEAFSWDVAEGLPLLLQDGAVSFVYGPGGLPLEQVNADGGVEYYQQDQQGSTRLVTDQAGTQVASYTYDPYGNLLSKAAANQINVALRYNGQYLDAESGLYYLRARYYDPTTGQFISRDPVSEVTHQPYAYASDNPLAFTDPSGMWDFWGAVTKAGIWIGQHLWARYSGLDPSRYSEMDPPSAGQRWLVESWRAVLLGWVRGAADAPEEGSRGRGRMPARQLGQHRARAFVRFTPGAMMTIAETDQTAGSPPPLIGTIQEGAYSDLSNVA